ncbi:MAG TPA: hypothetical protein VFZ34_04535 [Blastocatellia bacterium]|nr:hypothetical protein [Blastocatellia bacterium]
MEAVLEPPITLDPDKEYEIVDGIPKFLWHLAPSIAIVVVLPDDTYKKVINQIFDSFDKGVRQVWLMSPEQKTMTVYYSVTKHKILTEHDSLICEELLPGFSCKVGDLFTLPKRRQ